MIDKFKNLFDTAWIQELKNDYVNFSNISNVSNYEFFCFESKKHNRYGGALGRHGNTPTPRTDQSGLRDISNFFEDLLYAPDISILEYVSRADNKESFRHLKFLDYGAGLGLLSIFLKKIGIECHNYDDFSQLGDDIYFDQSFYEKYGINIPTKNLPCENIDVVTVAGIWIHEEEILDKDPEYLLLDAKYNTSSHAPSNIISRINSSYEKVDTCVGIMVHKKR